MRESVHRHQLRDTPRNYATRTRHARIIFKEHTVTKQLYDPHMFDFMWESVIPRDDMIVGTYYIEDTLEDQDFIDHLGQVERLAAEGSTSSWMDVKELTAGGARAADEQGARLLRDPGAQGHQEGGHPAWLPDRGVGRQRQRADAAALDRGQLLRLPHQDAAARHLHPREAGAEVQGAEVRHPRRPRISSASTTGRWCCRSSSRRWG